MSSGSSRLICYGCDVHTLGEVLDGHHVLLDVLSLVLCCDIDLLRSSVILSSVPYESN
jgi:hypothetical protein